MTALRTLLYEDVRRERSTGDLLLGYDFLSRSVRELDLSDDESQGSLRIEEFVPRTEFGRKLVALRRRAIERGMTLSDVETILAAGRRNRGERTYEEEDVA